MMLNVFLEEPSILIIRCSTFLWSTSVVGVKKES